MGNLENEIASKEHISENIEAKKGLIFGWDSDNSVWREIVVNSSGYLILED